MIGQIYTVAFAFSRNVAGAPNPATATVSAGGQTFDVSAANDGSFGSGHAMRWQTGSFNFTGNGSPTTLALAATHGGNGGVFFDKISVTTGGIQVTAVPEPATWALTILGFGLTGAVLRRQRALAVGAVGADAPPAQRDQGEVPAGGRGFYPGRIAEWAATPSPASRELPQGVHL